MYTVSDIIEKLILIEKDSIETYSIISNKFNNTVPALSIMAKALGREEERHIRYYKNLKKEIEGKGGTEIDFFLYDKVVKLLYEFKQRIQPPELQNVQDLIKYALEFEKETIGLLLDIQGRLVVKDEDTHKASYEVITKMIKEEREHEKMLEKYIM